VFFLFKIKEIIFIIIFYLLKFKNYCYFQYNVGVLFVVSCDDVGVLNCLLITNKYKTWITFFSILIIYEINTKSDHNIIQ